MNREEIKRIPYAQWRNSHLSIARYYWGISINWDYYEFDREEMKKLAQGENEVFPDLVIYK